jgi:hypothetical protein
MRITVRREDVNPHPTRRRWAGAARGPGGTAPAWAPRPDPPVRGVGLGAVLLVTRSGARLVEGTSPAPGKGTPNPLFLRHTAGSAGLYVALCDLGPSVGLTLSGWRRDEDAWEDWSGYRGSGRIRPDAYTEVNLEVDGHDGVAGAFVGVDFATMDQARLRAKVARHRSRLTCASIAMWWHASRQRKAATTSTSGASVPSCGPSRPVRPSSTRGSTTGRRSWSSPCGSPPAAPPHTGVAATGRDGFSTLPCSTRSTCATDTSSKRRTMGLFDLLFSVPELEYDDVVGREGFEPS